MDRRLVFFRAALLVIVSLLTANIPWGFAESQGDVTSTLSVYKVDTDKDKRETLSFADHAKPGDVLEYQVVYENKGKSAVESLHATLPVPAGLIYLPDTANPSTVEASLDGHKFERVPLKRMVKKPNGTLVEEPVPYSEYRYLGWPLGMLNAGKKVQAKARMRLE